MAVASPSPHPRAADGPTTVRRLPERSRPVSALVVALGVLVLYAAFGDGATELPQAAWLEVGVAAVGIAACAAWASGALRLRAAPWGWAGLALLVAFVVWTAAGIAWSVAPDRAWAELNRALAYAVTVVLGIAIGASDRRAPERVGRMLAVVAVPVA